MKRVSIFFIISFLFFLSCDDKKDDDNSPFSIIGSWNYFYLSNEDWVSNNINWVEYESIQSDIFDHLIASVKEFDLVLFQNPTGNDFRQIK